jgi:glycosyltransferase involved in cell wall biosynthesis
MKKTPGIADASMDIDIALDARYVQEHFPGIGRYVYHLAEALAELPGGPHLTLFYNPAHPGHRFNLAELADRFPTRITLSPVTARPFSLAEQWQLFRPARQGRFRAWHAPFYIRPYCLPLPVVLTAYDVISARLPAAMNSRKSRLAFEITTRLAFLTSSRIIAISQAAAGDIQRLYRVNPAKIRVVPLGVSKHFKPLDPAGQQEARARLNLPQRYLLYVGINKPHKNLARLLEAFKLYREQGGDPVKLILAGKEDFRYSGDLRDKARQIGIMEQVEFRGEITEADLPALYACADLFVFPSLYEGFGLPVLEAMACGTPVACADNSSLPEVAGDAAVLFPAGDVAAQAASIASALQQAPELRRKGLERARLFSWQRTAEMTLEVYKSLANKP